MYSIKKMNSVVSGHLQSTPPSGFIHASLCHSY